MAGGQEILPHVLPRPLPHAPGFFWVLQEVEDLLSALLRAVHIRYSLLAIRFSPSMTCSGMPPTTRVPTTGLPPQSLGDHQAEPLPRGFLDDDIADRLEGRVPSSSAPTPWKLCKM